MAFFYYIIKIMKKIKEKDDNFYLIKNASNNHNKKFSIVSTLETQNSRKKTKKSNIMAYSTKELQKIIKNRKNGDKKEMPSFKGSSLPIFLSSMTNARNNIKLINKKFINKSNNISNSFNSDNSALLNNSNNLNHKSINNNQTFEQNGKSISIQSRNNHKKLDLKINFPKLKNIYNIKLISSRNLNNYFSNHLDEKSAYIYNNNEIPKLNKNIYEPNKIFKSLNYTIDSNLEKYNQLNQKMKEISDLVNNKANKKKLNNIIYKKINEKMNISKKLEKNNDSKYENETKHINNSINSNYFEEKKFNNSALNIKTISEKNNLQVKGNKNHSKIVVKKNRQKFSLNKDNDSEKSNKIRKEKKIQRAKKKHYTFFIKKKLNEKKIKFIGLNNINNNNLDINENIFIKEIKFDNDYNEKYEYMDKKINSYKTSSLLNQKLKLEKIIFIKKEKLKKYNYFNNHESFEINEIKDNYINKMKKYRNIYSEVYENSILMIIFYNYLFIFNKCGLDMNLLNYMVLHVEFSSIYLPIVKFKGIDKNGRRGAIRKMIITNKLFSYKNKETLLNDEKTKFIEIKKNKKKLQFITINFITRDIINVNEDLKHINNYFLNDMDYFSTFSIKSSPKKKSPLRLKKSNYFRRSSRLPNRQITGGSISYVIDKTPEKQISILGQKNFFKKNTIIKNKIKQSLIYNLIYYKINGKQNNVMVHDDEKEVIKQIISTIHEYKINKNKRNTIDAFELIRKIKGKSNIEIILRTLIKEGEILLFTEYFNKNQRNIDINSRDEDGNSFLIICIKQEIYSLIDFLLERGIDVNIQNNEGNTALHYALSGKNFQMADILKKYGAKENCYNIYGFTPWDCVGKSIELN